VSVAVEDGPPRVEVIPDAFRADVWTG
jgi:hypothetical protein